MTSGLGTTETMRQVAAIDAASAGGSQGEKASILVQYSYNNANVQLNA
jgi:hypothetical protein